MHSIYKYPLEVTDDQNLELPKGSEILTVQVQYGSPQLWALTDPSEKKIERRLIRTHGTGHPIDEKDALKYIATYQLQNGSLVFHVFEVVKLKTKKDMMKSIAT